MVMGKFGYLICFAVAAVIVFLMLGIKDRIRRHTFFKKKFILQSKRDLLPDLEFCEKLSLDPSCLAFVSEVRKKLAMRGAYDPNRIYPEDDLWETFDFQIGDFLDEFAMNFIECGYGDLPYEELKSVGDFVKYLISKRKVA